MCRDGGFIFWKGIDMHKKVWLFALAAVREDVREQTSADAIEEMMDTATEGRGSFKKVKDSMVTGVTDADEPHAIAVIGAKYDKKSVVFRIAFDTEMNLIGLDVRGK